jgi:hypothetical protein
VMPVPSPPPAINTREPIQGAFPRCGICGCRMQRGITGQYNPDLIPWLDCGGDCLTCLAHAGDPDCISAIREWLVRMETT